MTATPILQFNSVRAAYPDGTRALRDVSFTIPSPASRVALLGGNGAGKSSVFLAAAGFLAFEGSIQILGESLPSARDSLQKAKLAAIRSRVGFVFENAADQLFLETLFDDIAFGPRNAGMQESDVKNRVVKALSAVGLDGFESRHPGRLSNGERRLAAVATALVGEPQLLILDEPTANLDARARRRVLKVISQFGGAVLLLTHDLAAAREITDRSVVLAEGSVVFEGETARAFADPRTRDALGMEDSTFLDPI